MIYRALHIIALASLAACGPSPARISAAVVVDKTPFLFIEMFDVGILRSKAIDGQPIDCSIFPNPISNLDDPRIQLVRRAQLTWQQSTEEANVQLQQIPSGEPLIVYVEGRANFPAGNTPHVVARGCIENQVFSPGAGNPPVPVNVTATTGAACSSDVDCGSPNLTCHVDPTLSLGGVGYCAKIGCGSNQECPPGAVCISDGASGGLCARRCSALSDCETVPQVHRCITRQGPDGCEQMCGAQQWNVGSGC